MAESIIGLYKAELFKQRGLWRNLAAVENATLAWVHWLNHQRLLEPKGNVPPIEFEAEYHRRNREHAIAACFTQNSLRTFRGGSVPCP